MGRAADGHGFRLVGHHDLDGSGDGMQIQRQGDTLYVDLGRGRDDEQEREPADDTIPVTGED